MKTPDSAERCRVLRHFQRSIGLKFKDISLLDLALTHRSYSNEITSPLASNERLEFLGDAILGSIVVEYLYLNLTDRNEGELAQIKSYVVSRDSLYEIAQQLQFTQYVQVGQGIKNIQQKSMCADILEALIGAYFLDRGFDAIKRWILPLCIPHIGRMLQNTQRYDYKSMLQIFTHKKYKATPQYTVVRQSGPDHDRKFEIDVSWNKYRFGHGKGHSKKEAEQDAAKIACVEFNLIQKN